MGTKNETVPNEINSLSDTITMAMRTTAERLYESMPKGDHPFISSLYRQIYGFLSDGGKRGHSQGLILSYQAVGGQDLAGILQVAAGFQLFNHHTAVDDDIYDDDKQRRGKPTVHEVFRRKFSAERNSQQISRNAYVSSHHPLFSGEAERKACISAMVYANMMRTFAFEAILSAPFDNEILYAVLKKLNWDSISIDVGQVLLEAEHVTDPKECLTIEYMKNAQLYATCAAAGAMLGRGSVSQIESLTEWGLCFGMAYGLQDDLEDIEPDSEKGAGRGVGSDIFTRKPTFLAMTAVHQAIAPYKEKLNHWLDNHSDEVDVTEIIDCFDKSGAINACNTKVRELLQQGTRALHRAEPKLDQECVRKMNVCADYFLSRSYWKRAMPENVAP